MIIDEYRTIKNESYGEYKDRGSKFQAYAYSIYSEKEFMLRLEEVKKMHHKARHHCYAYKIGVDGHHFRMNDDGEPSGTAGRPIYGVLEKYELTNIGIIVVRYFGGTKLGTSGLIQAYKQASLETIESAKIITQFIYQNIQLSFDYAIMGNLMSALNQLSFYIKDTHYESTTPHIIVSTKAGDSKSQIRKLKALLLHRPEADISEKTEVPQLSIKVLNS